MVRRCGFTAQLVRVADGFHIWSETYDRKLESVFALQDQIARRIADALKLSLGVSGPVAPRSPIDPKAYDEYLKGRALMRRTRDLPSAIAHLKAAVAKAPEFAAGWSSLSLTYEVSFWYIKQMTPAVQAEFWKGRQPRRSALPRSNPMPRPPNMRWAMSRVRNSSYALAERHYLRANADRPRLPDVREDYAELLYEVGRSEDSALAPRDS